MWRIILPVLIMCLVVTVADARQLLAENIDPVCLQTFCPMQAQACLNDVTCGTALGAVQSCLSDPTLVTLKDECDPVPNNYKPGDVVPRVLDQCVNLAVYLFKDNPVYYNLTRCSQVNNCLTGVDATGCQPVQNSNTGKMVKGPIGLWKETFDAMADSGKVWKVQKALHFGWCLRQMKHIFYCEKQPHGEVQRSMQYSVDVTASLDAFPQLQQFAPLGKNPAVWPKTDAKFVYNHTLCFYELDLWTGGVFEADPWTLLSAYPPCHPHPHAEHCHGRGCNRCRAPEAVLAITAVNVGRQQLPTGQYGLPDGYVFVPDGHNVPQEALQYWAKTYGLDFNAWCDTDNLWK